MALDFVLQHRSDRCLTTESEKVSFFTDECGIERSALPTRMYTASSGEAATARYFIEKQPILVTPPAGSGGQSMVTFTFIDEGLHSISGFESFLQNYRSLMRQIPNSCLMYIACSSDNFGAAARSFANVLGDRPAGSAKAETSQLLAFFRAKSAYERREFGTFNQQSLIRFREDRVRFSGPTNDELFRVWQAAGDDAVYRRIGHDTSSHTGGTCEFRSTVLTQKYDLFGNLTAGSGTG